MTELNPAMQAYDLSATAIDSNVFSALNRLVVSPRASGGLRSVVPQTSQSNVSGTYHTNFMNGAAWDLTVNGSNTNQVFSVVASSFTSIVCNVQLLILTASRPPVFNGASFGGQHLGGLLGTAIITPPSLQNGLLLASSVAGISTNFANLQVNEDFYSGNLNAQFGSTGGPYLMRAKWDIGQTLIGGSDDRITVTVRDDLTTRGISEIRAVAVSVQPV